MNSIVPDSFVVLSDFHSTEWTMDKVEKYYINEYENIFILGDATDRGPDGHGEQSFEILERIYDLAHKYPGRVHYVPGNHDLILYNAINGGVKEVDLLIQNGGSVTYNDYVNRYKGKNGRAKGEKIDKILDWVFNQPIQKTHSFAGKNYALAHALFNQEMYDKYPKLSLKDIGTNLTKKDELKDAYNILWFRKGGYPPFNTCKFSSLPSVDTIMVIGHTPEHTRLDRNLDLENENGDTIKVICVDGGVFKNDYTLKFDGNFGVERTLQHEHRDTSPKADILFDNPKYYDDSKNDVFKKFYGDLLNIDGKKSNNSFENNLEGLYCDIIDIILDNREKQEIINKFIIEYIKSSKETNITKIYYDLNKFFKDKNIELLTTDISVLNLAKNVVRILNDSFKNILLNQKTISEHIDKVVLDYIIECLIEKGYDSAKQLTGLFLEGNFNCITSNGGARDLARTVGVKKLKMALKNSNFKTIDDYVDDYLETKDKYNNINNNNNRKK